MKVDIFLALFSPVDYFPPVEQSFFLPRWAIDRHA